MVNSENLYIWKQQIRELQDAYSLAMDHGEFRYFNDIFTEDIQANYGIAGTGSGLESLKTICREALEPLDTVQHINGNHWARIDSQSAEAGCYFRVHMTRENAVGGEHFEMGGKYTDQLTLTENGWRISKRKIDIIWNSGNPEVRFPSTASESN
mgnify:FL=1|tara:strand:+ start:315 stop:776 length:462 start_codon:yes stop_codon:yes gene_type:complete